MRIGYELSTVYGCEGIQIGSPHRYDLGQVYFRVHLIKAQEKSWGLETLMGKVNLLSDFRVHAQPCNCTYCLNTDMALKLWD